MAAILCPRLILEGTHLTYETEIAIELNEQLRIVRLRKDRCHTPQISANEVPRAVERIADWLEEIGGLWAS